MTIPVHLKASIVLPVTLLIIIAIFASTPYNVEAQPPGGVLTVKLEGTITSVSYENMVEALTHAETSGETVVLLIDTPGGVLDDTFKIIDLIERSTVPVVGYVFPPGSEAWSAGTYILMATHVASMAPSTIIGSAQPVTFDPVSGGSKPVEDSKIINAMVKFIAERAKAHGRNEEIARRFVTENLNLDDEEALNASVIEVRASTIDELLSKIDGRSIIVGGVPYTLKTAGSPVSEWSPSLRVRFFSVISEPVIAYLLFIVGFFSLIFGFSTPGFGAEILGAFLIIMGLMGLGVFGINIGAMVIMAAGFVLLLAELFTHGHGILGVAGIACVFLGGVLLFPREWTVRPESLSALYTILIVVPLAAGAFFLFVAYKVLQARMRKPLQRGIVGEEAEVIEEISAGRDGFVRTQGELWKARSPAEIQRGSRVRIVGKEGPVLIVEPLDVEKA